MLRTARLVLRPFRTDDAKPLHAVLSDPETMRFWDDPHQTPEETLRFVEATMAAPAKTTCDFVIEKDGEVIGKMGMWRAPEIGFFVARAYQRQGLAREALAAVTTHLFRAYPGIVALTADVDPRNEASLALLQGAGFKITGTAERTICIGGDWCDSVFLALRRPAPD